MPDSDPSPESLDARLRRLERRVDRLAEAVKSLQVPVPPDEAPGEVRSDEAPSEESSPESPPSGLVASLRAAIPTWTGEQWLSRVGIGLVLFGLAFLFKYSIDQGWLGPAVRVGFGTALGAVLFTAGIRLYDDRMRLGQVLLGGGAGAFYTTLYAAFQLYGLLAYPYAFAAMVTVTVVTVALGVKQDDAALTGIGFLGGFATPFVLAVDDGSVAGLVGYTLLLAGGAGAVYLRRGWRSALAMGAGGGALCLFVAADAAGAMEAPGIHGAAAAAGAAVWWALTGGLPVLRAQFHRRDPARWPRPALPGGDWVGDGLRTATRYAVVNGAPLLGLRLAAMALPDVDGTVWGAIALLGAAGYGAAAVGLTRGGHDAFAPAHTMAAVVLSVLGAGLVLDGAVLLLLWAAQTAALLEAGRRMDDAILRTNGVLLGAGVAIWIGVRILLGSTGTPLVSAHALSTLAATGILGGAAWRAPTGRLRTALQLVVYLAWLGWWARELGDVANGQAVVSAVWGTTAVVLLVAGARTGGRRAQRVGLATLFAFVAKLFLIDLAALPTVWRILLFLASGGLLLLVSYAMPGLVTRRNAKGE